MQTTCKRVPTLIYPIFALTLTYKDNQDIMKTYLYTKDEVSRSKLSKVRAETAQTDRQTDRHTQTDVTIHITTTTCVGGTNADDIERKLSVQWYEVAWW